MKIIHLLMGKANPDRMNGVNKVVHLLATTQSTEGLEVAIWGITPTPNAPVTDRDLPTCLFARKRYGRLDAILARALHTEVMNNNGNVLFHLHGAFIIDLYFVAKHLQKIGAKYFFTPHGSYSEAAMQKGWRKKKLYFDLFEEPLLLGASRIHLLGSSEVEGLAKLTTMTPAKILLLPNGINIADIPRIVVHPAVAATKPTHFVFCGRLDTHHKGLDALIDGFAEYKNTGGKGTLTLIGDGSDRQKLEAQAAALGQTNTIDFVGQKMGQEKWDLLATATAFLHTSRMEGFPMSVVEAAALGLPCITSEATNVNGYLRQYNAGIALPDITPQSIAVAMHQIDTHQQNNTLLPFAQNARKMAQEAFDIKSIVQQLADAYAA